MPCGSLAVQTAQLETNVVEELLRSETLRESFRLWLSQQLGAEVELELSEAWVRGATHARVQGDPYIRATCRARDVVLAATLKTGLVMYGLNGGQLKAETVEQFLTALARLAAQQRLVDAIGTEARVLQDTALSNGLRTLQLEL